MECFAGCFKALPDERFRQLSVVKRLVNNYICNDGESIGVSDHSQSATALSNNNIDHQPRPSSSLRTWIPDLLI